MNNPQHVAIHKQGQRYENDEDKRNGYLEAHRGYNATRQYIEKWTCNLCNKTLSIGNKYHHIRTKIHINNTK